MAREFGLAHSSVQRQERAPSAPTACCCSRRLRPKGAPTSPWSSTACGPSSTSQVLDLDLNVLVGASHYVYGFNDAELRRSGACDRPSGRGAPRSRPPTGGRTPRRRGRPSPRLIWAESSARRRRGPRLRRARGLSAGLRTPCGSRIHHRTTSSAGEPDASRPATSRPTWRTSCCVSAARTTARDDRLLEAAPGGALPRSDLGSMARLHEVGARRTVATAAGSRSGWSRRACAAGRPRRAPLPVAPGARPLARALLLTRVPTQQLTAHSHAQLHELTPDPPAASPASRLETHLSLHDSALAAVSVRPIQTRRTFTLSTRRSAATRSVEGADRQRLGVARRRVHHAAHPERVLGEDQPARRHRRRISS